MSKDSKNAKAPQLSLSGKSLRGFTYIFQVVSRLESAYFFQSSISFVNSSSAGSKLSFFVSVQIQFNDLFDTVLAKDYRNTDANV